jgi:hypothetical protein
MECPGCGLLSPESAERCDCGYSFATQRQERAGASDAAESPTNRGVSFVHAAAGFGVGVLCALVALAPEIKSWNENHVGLRGLGLVLYTLMVAMASGGVFVAGLGAMAIRAVREAGATMCAAGLGAGLVALGAWMLISLTP